jgi:type I restriction enzyme, S subunit
MTLATFFQKFDQFADAPNAVAKMRELVLELAVRGRLFSSGTSASSDLSAPFSLPRDWQWIALNKAADCRAAAKVDSSSLKDSDWILDLEDIDGGAGKVIATATFAERRSLSTKASFISGDVLYGKLRPYLNKVVIADRPGFCTTEIIPLRPQPFVTSGYLRLFLRSPYFLKYAAAKNYGMKMPRLGTKDLESAEIPLPPLAEQKQIVAKVDELMALCDRLETQLQERETRHGVLARASLARFAGAPTPANLDFLFHRSYVIPPADLRKSILTLAVQGKLVPQDPNDEPADVFLGLIAQRLGKSKGKRSTNNGAAAADEAKPFDLPPGWRWSRFPDLGEFGRGKSKHRPRNDPSLFVGGTHRLVQTGDVARSNGTIQTHTGLYNEVGLAQSRKWPAGTLCITIAANIADSGILGFDACFPDSVVGFIPAAPIPSVHYFEFFMRTAKEHLEQFAPSTAQKNINLGILERVWIPVPPLAEQRRIVAKVEQLMALVNELETHLAASQTTGENLLSALVAKFTLDAVSAREQQLLAAKTSAAPQSSPEFTRAVLAAEVTHRLSDHDTFGQVKLQKLLYLVEYHFHLPQIDSHPLRYAAGPHDPQLMSQIEGKMAQCDWFQEEPRPGGNGHRYRPLKRVGTHCASFEQLWPAQATAIRSFIDGFKTWKTERCERLATLYAAWNDLLLWKHEVTDAGILREVLENWHAKKLEIPRARWLEMLAWMRHEKLIPIGFGRATAESPQPKLFSI